MKSINDDPPHSKEVLLWLKAPEGTSDPVGWVVATYKKTEFYTGWTEKSASGNINTGLRNDLITHWMELPDEP